MRTGLPHLSRRCLIEGISGALRYGCAMAADVALAACHWALLVPRAETNGVLPAF